MNKLFLFAGILAFIVSCNQTGKTENQKTEEPVAENIITASIEDLLADPEAFEGKEVALKGMVTHVCRHGGQKCFALGEDGETQIRIQAGEGIDEFETSLEGSTVAFKGVFKVLNLQESEEHVEDHESKEHHSEEMAHTEAEKASYFVEAVDFKEITE